MQVHVDSLIKVLGSTPDMLLNMYFYTTHTRSYSQWSVDTALYTLEYHYHHMPVFWKCHKYNTKRTT